MSNSNPNQRFENAQSIGTKTNLSEWTRGALQEDLPVAFFVRTSEEAGRRQSSELVGGPPVQGHKLDSMDLEVSSQA